MGCSRYLPPRRRCWPNNAKRNGGKPDGCGRYLGRSARQRTIRRSRHLMMVLAGCCDATACSSGRKKSGCRAGAFATSTASANEAAGPVAARGLASGGGGGGSRLSSSASAAGACCVASGDGGGGSSWSSSARAAGPCARWDAPQGTRAIHRRISFVGRCGSRVFIDLRRRDRIDRRCFRLRRRQSLGD